MEISNERQNFHFGNTDIRVSFVEEGERAGSFQQEYI